MKYDANDDSSHSLKSFLQYFFSFTGTGVSQIMLIWVSLCMKFGTNLVKLHNSFQVKCCKNCLKT